MYMGVILAQMTYYHRRMSAPHVYGGDPKTAKVRLP